MRAQTTTKMMTPEWSLWLLAIALIASGLALAIMTDGWNIYAHL